MENGVGRLSAHTCHSRDGKRKYSRSSFCAAGGSYITGDLDEAIETAVSVVSMNEVAAPASSLTHKKEPVSEKTSTSSMQMT